jgi:hypothetical protein
LGGQDEIGRRARGHEQPRPASIVPLRMASYRVGGAIKTGKVLRVNLVKGLVRGCQGCITLAETDRTWQGEEWNGGILRWCWRFRVALL